MPLCIGIPRNEFYPLRPGLTTVILIIGRKLLINGQVRHVAGVDALRVFIRNLRIRRSFRSDGSTEIAGLNFLFGNLSHKNFYKLTFSIIPLEVTFYYNVCPLRWSICVA